MLFLILVYCIGILFIAILSIDILFIRILCVALLITTFLYVIYSIILLCVVGAIIGIWWPQQTFQAAENLSKLLGAIPENLWWLFGAGYLGYTGARSFDKWRGADR